MSAARSSAPVAALPAGPADAGRSKTGEEGEAVSPRTIALGGPKFIRQILTDPRIGFDPKRLDIIERRDHSPHSVLKIIMQVLNMEVRDKARVIYSFLDHGNVDFSLIERSFKPEQLTEAGLVEIFTGWLARRERPRLDLPAATPTARTDLERNRQLRALGVT